jgi:predicted molibdopterin-dependent oxidoreductase YjgC
VKRFSRRALHPDIRLDVDGLPVPAVSGQSLLGVLVAVGCWTQRRHPVTHRPEAGICGMGTCQACEVLVDGRRVRACAVEAEDGMRVSTASGAEAS